MNEIAKHKLTMKAYDKLGTLERILRVIRHRGGHIESLQMQLDAEQILTLTLELTTDRSISALQNQLLKLVDIISVEL
ncbi:hypothetical protein A9G11_10425 [Gilliamella sp. wkB108]|uniref:acetolactate synthase 2 small subunit n=1 Tax=Gilliamella sp. wkB108 TaxID=3120256 RepID=UPI00080D8F96|nr:acetolactate synthase 2 small subunit [Gilliamella apicola]OCG28632.1 hypothetical protein A9G11_10425 [Gilliamella apicola]